MSYLQEFKTQINNRDFNKFMQLWEEYCTSDVVDVEEFSEILKSLKNSELAKPFGRIVETALPLWELVSKFSDKYQLFKLLIDLQTTNSPLLAEIAINMIKQKYPNDPQFNERCRLVGLRNKDNFQEALSNYDLLAHVAKGKFVYHNGGWGAGEIVDLSLVREQVTVEFENVAGRKHFTFANAFKNIVPLEDHNFLVRRFADPDTFEAEANANPLEIIKLLLKDLGPKNAAEIKEELCGLVINEKDWTKWWQGARAKIKKDPMIETPVALKDPFRLRSAELTQEERLQRSLHGKTNIDERIQSSYNFIRDLPNTKKNQDVKNTLKEKTLALLEEPDLQHHQKLQIIILLENFFSHQLDDTSSSFLIKQAEDVEQVVNDMDILALKKRALTLIKEHRSDWRERFLSLLDSVSQSPLRDYITKELNQGSSKELLNEKIKDLIHHPSKNPELFVWYFNKVVNEESKDLPYHDKDGHLVLFESFLILYSLIDLKSEYRDLTKKMYTMISGKRYEMVRRLIEGSSIEFIKEFLLLVAKCQSFTDHDLKIMRSLAEVVHPSLIHAKQKKASFDHQIIWTTEAGYLKTQERVRHIGTVEIVENAREIEAARALGDLRENSEYKFALEKRSRLQGELKTLSEQLSRARIITPEDIHPDEAGVGSVVEITEPHGSVTHYTILGPWDADPEAHILSFQSKLAQAMAGCKEGDSFKFRDEEFVIVKLRSYLD